MIVLAVILVVTCGAVGWALYVLVTGMKPGDVP